MWEDIPSLTDAQLSRANLKEAILVDIDLSKADLTGAILEGADLRKANLCTTRLVEANLRRANLNGANLSEANLSGANLTNADLSRTDLSRAILGGANLRGANLTGTNMQQADFSQADLRDVSFAGADLSYSNVFRAKFDNTIFADANLSYVANLETCEHAGPLSVGIDTIIRSPQRLPEQFLRGCGIQERFFEYVQSLTGSLEPIEFYSCFISYSHADEAFTKRLFGRLREDGLRVWYAPEDMKRGEKIHEQIDSAIRIHDKLLLVLSEANISSNWVQHEIRTALRREEIEKRKLLFPVAIYAFENVQEWECFDADRGRDMATVIREYYIPDLSGWKNHDNFETEYEKLLHDLKKTAQDELLRPRQ
jgi:uncharacterized protein YjbI with pentapeptide repeats